MGSSNRVCFGDLTMWYSFAFMFQLDDWVLCRIYKKRQAIRHLEEKTENAQTQLDISHAAVDNDDAAAAASNEQQMVKFPRPCSLSHLLELEYMCPISQILNVDTNNNPNFDCQYMMSNAGMDHVGKIQPGEMIMPHQYPDYGKFHVPQGNSSFNQQPLLVNQTMVYGFQ